jgi:hypothetical protein
MCVHELDSERNGVCGCELVSNIGFKIITTVIVTNAIFSVVTSSS